MNYIDNHVVTRFAKTHFRNQRQVFGIRTADRRAHMYIVGKSGTGKSTLLENLMQQDLEHGHGFVLIDPHGDLVKEVLRYARLIPQREIRYLDAGDPACPLGLNPLASRPGRMRMLAASGVLEAFKGLWIDSWGPRLEHILRNVLLALVELPDTTFADATRLMEEPTYRRHAAAYLTNPAVRRFWTQEYELYPARLRAEAIAPLQNKLGAFLTSPVLTRILVHPLQQIDLRDVMDKGQVLLVNLAKGRIGSDTAALLGALIVAEIATAGMSRADTPPEQRRDFFVYLDEFQNIGGLALVNMLSELRKFRAGLVLAHQYMAQLDPRVRDAVLGNVGTIISFRVGMTDAEILEKEFYPDFTARDLVSLPNRHIYLRLMIDGQVSKPFSAVTLSPNEASLK